MSPRWGFGRGRLPRNHGLTPMATTCRPVGTKHISPWRNRIQPLCGDIASSRNAATLHLAATRRQDVAMGVSPWNAAPPLAQSPKGTTGAMNHVAPSGLRKVRLPLSHGLTPMATTCRPVGTKHISPWRNRISQWHHRIAQRRHRIAARRHRISARRHRISSRCHRCSPLCGDIASSRNAATGCSHGRKPMDRLPSFVAGLYLTIRKLGSLL
jgi:hypothetical protein